MPWAGRTNKSESSDWILLDIDQEDKIENSWTFSELHGKEKICGWKLFIDLRNDYLFEKNQEW